MRNAEEKVAGGLLTFLGVARAGRASSGEGNDAFDGVGDDRIDGGMMMEGWASLVIRHLLEEY